MGHSVPISPPETTLSTPTMWKHVAGFFAAFQKYNNAHLIDQMTARRRELDAMTDAELAKLGVTRKGIAHVVVMEFIED